MKIPKKLKELETEYKKLGGLSKVSKLYIPRHKAKSAKRKKKIV